MNFSGTSSYADIQEFQPDETFLPGERPENNKPVIFGSLTSIVLLAWSVRLAAAVNLIASMLRHEPKLIYWLGSWVPFEISEGRRILMLLTSVLLFVLASGLERGKRAAWLMTIGVLTLAPILHLGRAVVWPHALLNLGVIGFLVLHHRYFVARSDQRSVRTALIICPLMLAGLLIFGTVRLQVLHKQTSGDHSLVGCLQTSGELALVQNTDTQQALTGHATHLFSVLRVGGMSIALAGLFLILRPVLMRNNSTARERARVAALVSHYGVDTLDVFSLLNDKSYFFAANGRAVVPYVLSSNLAVALGNPIGHQALREAAVAEFAAFCRRQDWEPVFHQVTRDLAPCYEAAGFSLFKIGEEALIQPDHFQLKGREFQNLRTACNRAHKLGIRFVAYPGGTECDEALEEQLGDISKRWLNHKKGQEMTFDMGAYAPEDIRARGAHVAIDSTGKALAFATWRPYAQGRGRTLDLMRSLPEARNVMDFILAESILHFREEGVDEVNLGSAPLANVQSDLPGLTAEETVVRFLYENLNRIYGYKSLFEFKRKYRPQWKGRYVAYRRGVNLPLVGLALVRVHAPEGIVKFLIG